MTMPDEWKRWALKAFGAILPVAVLALGGCRAEQDHLRQRRTMGTIENAWKIIRPGILGGSVKIPRGARRDLNPFLIQMGERNALTWDGWGNWLSVEAQVSIKGHKFSYCIESPGEDHAWDASPRLGPFMFWDYARDLIFCDGRWVSYPFGVKALGL
jgi:hypothetical protein